MKPIRLKKSNVIYGENQPDYIPLPAHKDESGIVTTCWGLNFLERLRVLWTGFVIVRIMTFNEPLQPLNVDTKP